MGEVKNPALIAHLEGQVAPATQPPAGMTAPPGFDLVPLTAPVAGKAESQDLSNDNTRVNIRQGERQLQQVDYSNATNLRGEFQALPQVKNYEMILQPFASAVKAGPGGAGDLDIIYALGKVMDPNSVVREGELDMANNTGSLGQQLQGYYKSVSQGGKLPPEVRRGLLDELRVRGGAAAAAYNQKRIYYENLAKKNGFDPAEIVGPHPAEPFQQAEADYLGRPVRNMDGGQGPAPQGQGPIDPNGEGDIGFAQDRSPTKDAMNPEQVAAYNAFLANNPQATADDLVAFSKTIGLPGVSNAQEIIDFYKKTGQFAPGSSATFEKPDISDVRGKGGTGEAIDAGVRGAADALTFGAADEIAAGAKTVFGDGTMRDNLARERAVDDYDAEHNFTARLAGQLGSAFVMPSTVRKAALSAARESIAAGATREATIDAIKRATIARMGAEGAAYGGAYGFGSGEGDISDRVANAAVDAVTGGLAGNLAGRVGINLAPKTAPKVPPLVDPVTGALNEPLEAAGPAARVAAAKGFGIDLPMGAAGDRTAAILEKGFDISPASAGLMNDARRVTEGQVSAAADDVASRFGTARTMNEGGGAAQRGANEWMGRLGALTTKLYNAIPIAPQAKAAVSNTSSKLADMTSRFASNPKLAEMVNSPKLAQFKQAIDDHGLSWQDLKGFRSWVGEKIGERRFSEDDATSDFRALYGALSEDMRATAAANGPKALKAFERANDIYAKGQQRIEDHLVSILGDNAKQNPESAMAAIQRLTRSGKGSADLNKLEAIRRSTVKSGEWDQVSSTLIRLMGKPAQSEGRNFDPAVFVRNYADMTEPARNLMFGGKRELREALDEFVAVNQRLAGSNSLRNTSNTAPGITAAGTIGGISAAATNPLLGLKLATGAAANYGLAKLWTNPKFVRWFTGYNKMLAGAAKGSLNPAKLKVHERLLINLANKETAIQAEANDLRQQLFGDDKNAPK